MTKTTTALAESSSHEVEAEYLRGEQAQLAYIQAEWNRGAEEKAERPAPEHLTVVR